MTELSPQAQAVWDAYELVDCDPYEIDPRKAGLSAALEAAADEVVPERQEPAEPPGYGSGSEPPQYVEQWTCWNLRQNLLAVAAELRGDTTTNQEGYSSHA
jgi:hypothetical protein